MALCPQIYPHVGGYVRVVGHCLYENVATPGQWIIRFKPSNDWYEI
jgi:hypothetical protein